MVGEIYIENRVSVLKVRAAQKYNISPEKCHIGHVNLQALLMAPSAIHQIDAVNDFRETNLSVANRSMRLASALNNSGLKVGAHVVIIGHNNLDLVIPFYACYYNGYASCNIDPSITSDDIIALFQCIHPNFVFCSKGKVADVKTALERVNRPDAQIVTFDDTQNDLQTFIKANKGNEVNFRPAVFDQSKTTAWLMLTSGTTGIPKAAIIPFDTLLNGVCCWWAGFSKEYEYVLAMATIQWMSSLLFFTAGPIMKFTRIQSSVPLTPQLLVGLINKYKPNVTAWTPYLLGQFLASAGHICDLSSFKVILIGGSAIEKPLLDKFREKCAAYLYLMYGMTELLVPVFDFNKNTPFGSTGRPFKKYEYRIVNEEGKDSETHKTGELHIRGDDFFKGYLNNAEETSKMLTDDGWVKTGDIFYKDEQDYYYFVERKRLLIKYTGFWNWTKLKWDHTGITSFQIKKESSKSVHPVESSEISPLQLEEIISRHPGVKNVCVVGIPDREVTETPVAAIVRSNGTAIKPEDIFKLVTDAMPDIKHLHGGIFFINALPETPSGKIHRAKLREIAQVSQRILPNLKR